MESHGQKLIGSDVLSHLFQPFKFISVVFLKYSPHKEFFFYAILMQVDSCDLMLSASIVLSFIKMKNKILTNLDVIYIWDHLEGCRLLKKQFSAYAYVYRL